MRSSARFAALPSLVALALFAPARAAAQTQAPSSDVMSAGPVARRTRGPGDRPEVTAVPIAEPIRIDGVLDDAVWQRSEPITGFVQAEPLEGEPATERTEVWIAFDDDNLYIAAILHDRDPDGLVVNDIRKDFREEDQDGFAVILDTFQDRRNGYVFMTNPEGAKGDRQVANEGREINTSWDAVWSVKTARGPDGWTAEMAIPFRALRFDERSGGVWGVNFSRRIRRKNELAFWAPVPRSFNLARVSLAGDLTGLPVGAGGRDLRVKPYAAAGTVRETGGEEFDGTTDVGLDVKYGLTEGLTLDLTVNPDFAQVEADEQQVNLTQFSQLFPEKREFFLENSGLFYVGDAARNNRVNVTPTPDEDLLLFFSRRIGLTSDGRSIPIHGGARLTGQVAGLSVGALAMRTGDLEGSPSNDYGILRVRRNVFSASDVGAIFLTRQAVDGSDDYNRVWGADANFRLPGNVDWSSYGIRTETPGVQDGQYAWRTSLNRESNFSHIKVGLMVLGEGFNDDLGYYRRVGVRKWFMDAGIRPRFQSLRRLGIREMHPHLVWNYYEDLGGRMVAKRLHSGYTFFRESGAYIELSINPSAETVESSFRIAPGVSVPAGSYSWSFTQARLNTDPSRVLSVAFTGQVGGLWTGDQKSINTTVTLKPSYHFRAELGVQRTHAELDLPKANFTKSFWTGRTNYSFNTNMFVDALVQYDPGSKQFNSNVRFNLIHHPLSDIFLVYNEQRFMTDDAVPPGRAVTLKVTQMVAF